MVNNTEKILDSLLDSISTMEEVQSIGISGGKTPLPKAGQDDFDIFIYCDTIPGLDKRKSIISQFGDSLKDVKINVIEGGHWGIGDFVLINGVETWLMYFTVNETLNDIKSILNGEYPDKLAETIIQYHLNKLEDTEDLDRAVMRKEVLFYHFAMDLAIDSFLQALFALNRTYFPSRKRTLNFCSMRKREGVWASQNKPSLVKNVEVLGKAELERWSQ